MAAKSANDELADSFTTHTIDILRVAEGQRAEVITALEKLEAGLVIEVQKAAGKSPLSQARVRALGVQTRATIKDAYSKIDVQSGKALAAVANLEAKNTVKAINTTIGVPVATVAMSKEQLTTLAGKTLVNGKFPSEWWATQAAGTQDRFMQQMRIGTALGEGVDKLAARVRGTKAMNYTDGIMLVSKRQAEALVRTSTATVANEAKLATFANNSDLIKGIQWLSTLDSRTTPICKALDGKQWDLNYKPINGNDKAWPGPIAHWGCRSTQTSVLKSWAELAGPGANLKALEAKPGADLDDMLRANLVKNQGMSVEQAAQAASNKRESMDGGAPATQTFEGFLRGKSAEFQNAVLGDGKAKLWRAGDITVSDMTDQQNRPLSLAQLHNLVEGKAPSAGFTDEFLTPGLPAKVIDAGGLLAAEQARDAALAAHVATQEEIAAAYAQAKGDLQEAKDERTAAQEAADAARRALDAAAPDERGHLTRTFNFAGKDLAAAQAKLEAAQKAADALQKLSENNT